MGEKSAGILMFRKCGGVLEFLLVHPGGPFWAKKDAGAWTIPKGRIEEDEPEIEAARREFFEETGVKVKEELIELGSIKQKSGKTVMAWAVEGDVDVTTLKSNEMRMQWPPRSGKWISIPEVDRWEFFDLETARKKVNPAQVELLERVERHLQGG